MLKQMKRRGSAGIGALALAAGLVIAAPQAQAQTGWYVGGGAATFDVDTGSNGDLTLGAIQGRIGYQLLGLLAVEGEAAFGIGDDDLDLPGIPGAPKVMAGLENEFGAFAVGRLPVGLVNVFARAGYATMTFDAGAVGLSASDEGSGPAYGLGADIQVFSVRGRLDWTRYEIDEGESDSFGLSVVLSF